MDQSRLESVLEPYRKDRWLLVRPGGNWGDFLIYQGAEALLSRLGIEYRSLAYSEFMGGRIAPDEHVFIHGHGGYNEWCSGTPFEILRKAVRETRGVVVQAPCSTTADENSLVVRLLNYSLIDIRAERVVFFARETCTYELLEALGLHSRGIELYIDHDTALRMTREDFLARVPPRLVSGHRGFHLVVDRRDGERNPARKAPILRFISLRLDAAVDCASFDDWLAVHALAKSISSNRLHSAIAGAILGVPTVLSAGAYHKNHSVWRYSLRARGVSWDRCASYSSPLVARMPERLWSSYKYRALVRRWYLGSKDLRVRY